MNVSDFIEKYFIEEIGSLVEDHPFVAFTLMSIGVEFLGKCLNPNPWNDPNERSSRTFSNAINSFISLNKYSVVTDLYHNLRCGLAHRFMVQGQIILAPDKNDLTGTTITIGCKDFYADFKQACIDAIINKNGMIKKNLADEYDIEVDGVTGSTQTANTQAILMRRNRLHPQKKFWLSFLKKIRIVKNLRNIHSFLN